MKHKPIVTNMHPHAFAYRIGGLGNPTGRVTRSWFKIIVPNHGCERLKSLFAGKIIGNGGSAAAAWKSASGEIQKEMLERLKA